MRNITAFLFILLICSNNINGQQKKVNKNPFQMVEVPDTISQKLEEAYTEASDFQYAANAGKNVWNLINRKDFTFKNGIYSFKGQGPHFPRRIFIFSNGKLFIFKNIGAFEPAKIVEEYLKCIKELDLSDDEVRIYLVAISKYIKDEEGQTYGNEKLEYRKGVKP
jgi:hypothetical protein